MWNPVFLKLLWITQTKNFILDTLLHISYSGQLKSHVTLRALQGRENKETVGRAVTCQQAWTSWFWTFDTQKNMWEKKRDVQAFAKGKQPRDEAEFPSVAVTNDQNFGGLKQQNFFLQGARSWDSKIKLSKGCAISGGSGRESIPCLF